VCGHLFPATEDDQEAAIEVASYRMNSWQRRAAILMIGAAIILGIIQLVSFKEPAIYSPFPINPDVMDRTR
jgi:hypothetical protein